ncbi:hypothetical protein RB195_019046 [Necator americanus]|uniref:Uncharacterized protein n=1 Tax=Necator americanus TaxID=51031 RepID=A0ABR1CCD6_NECAM
MCGISSTRFVPSPLLSKMFSTFMSDVDEPIYLLLIMWLAHLCFAFDIYSAGSRRRDIVRKSELRIYVVARCVEEVPRASPIHSVLHSETRRAPVYKPKSAAPRARAFKRFSTGVRRSPNSSKSASVVHSPRIPHPLVGPAIPLPSMLPMSFPTVTFPPMMSFPTLPTFATIAMPTLPTMTMPPSFQRLMGITTTPSPKRSGGSKRVESKEEDVEEEGLVKKLQESSERRSVRALSPISSRLPKFVNRRKISVVSPEQNADWIVPF